MKRVLLIISVILFLFISLNVKAQVALNVPSNTHNNRFYSDIFNIQRPALSVVGFDNNSNSSKGYGLKQILEELYNEVANPLMVQTFNKIVQLSNTDLTDPFNTPGKDPLNVVNDNSNKLQARAFVALARYVLYKNGITAQIPDFTQTAPGYSTAIADLRSAFQKPVDWLLANNNHKDDPVKWTRTAGSYARALDLYLALENA